jgi:hypothetical protein
MASMEKITIMLTIGFRTEIPEPYFTDIIDLAMKHIRPEKPDMIVFTPNTGEHIHLEDEGRTLIIPMLNLPKKIYAKHDNFRPPETWDNIYSPEDAQDLKDAGIRQYTLTIMLAEEY